MSLGEAYINPRSPICLGLLITNFLFIGPSKGEAISGSGRQSDDGLEVLIALSWI